MAAALPPEVRFAIYDRHLAGESLQDIATELNIHYETARKWWRVGRLQGREALMKQPRKPIGIAHRMPQPVAALIVKLRREHKRWGLPYLRQQVLADPSLTEEEKALVPSQANLYRYIHRIEDKPFKHRLRYEVPGTPLIKQAQYPHHLWQVDLKEKCSIKGLWRRVTVVNMRDIHSSVTTGSVLFELQRSVTALCQADIQAACRSSFERWGLPDRIRTDNGSCFVATMPQTGFPSYLTLWLAGLGIAHETIAKGKVTQNGCVERYNRTYANLVLRDGPFENLQQVQALSETTVAFLNNQYPSQAGSCHGTPPLVAHPEAAQPRRPYCVDHEAACFDLQRVDAWLTRFRWQRHADEVGKVSLGRTDYYLGREHKGQVFDINFDPSDRSFVFQTPDASVSLRRPAIGLDAEDIANIRDSQNKRLRKPEKRP